MFFKKVLKLSGIQMVLMLHRYLKRKFSILLTKFPLTLLGLFSMFFENKPKTQCIDLKIRIYFPLLRHYIDLEKFGNQFSKNSDN